MKQWKITAALLVALLLGTAFSPADAHAAYSECDGGKHSLYQAEVRLQTCTTDGYYILKCCNCSYSERVVTEKAGHSWEQVGKSPATCTSDALIYYECSRCDARDTVSVINSAPGHKYGTWQVVQAPTCTTAGKSVKTCTACGKTVEQTISPSHTFGAWTVLTPANCTQEGIKARECDCGYTERAAIPATGKHSFGAWTVLTPANCMDEGIKARECDCGYTERASIPTTDHKWSEGIVAAQPSTTSEGIMLYVCSYCGMERTRPIPKLTEEEAAKPTPEASLEPASGETPEPTGAAADKGARGTEKGDGKSSGKSSGSTSGSTSDNTSDNTPGKSDAQTAAPERPAAKSGQAGIPVWAICLIALGGALIVAAVVIIIVRKKRNKETGG